MKNKKNNKGLILCLILFVLISCGLGGVIAYDKVFNKTKCPENQIKIIREECSSQIVDEGENNNNSNSNNEFSKELNIPTTPISKIENTNISIGDAINYVDEYYKMSRIKLPQLVGKAENISTLNSKILNEVLPKTYFGSICYSIDANCMSKGIIFNYKYKVEKNILVIYIYSSLPTGGNGAPSSNEGLDMMSYFYDIANDKILTLSEAATKLGLKVESNNIIIIENDILKVVNTI